MSFFLKAPGCPIFFAIIHILERNPRHQNNYKQMERPYSLPKEVRIDTTGRLLHNRHGGCPRIVFAVRSQQKAIVG